MRKAQLIFGILLAKKKRSLTRYLTKQGGPTGENLAAGYANATASVDAWGLERKMYNFKKPTGFSEKTGHFTQLVWGNTTSVGCAVKSCQGENGDSFFFSFEGLLLFLDWIGLDWVCLGEGREGERNEGE